MLHLKACWADAQPLQRHTLYPWRCGCFPLPTELPETCLERPKRGHQHPNYILSRTLILPAFIRNCQSLRVQRTARPGAETTRAASHAEGVAAASPRRGCPPQNRQASPPPSPPRQLARAVFENENEPWLCCVCEFCHRIF